MSWEQARNLPWGVLILVGGGLSLGTAIERPAGWRRPRQHCLKDWRTCPSGCSWGP